MEKPMKLAQIISEAFTVTNSRFVQSCSDFCLIFLKFVRKPLIGRPQRSQDEDVDFPLKP